MFPSPDAFYFVAAPCLEAYGRYWFPAHPDRTPHSNMRGLVPPITPRKCPPHRIFILQARRVRTMPIPSSINPPFELLLRGSFGTVSDIPGFTRWGAAEHCSDVGGWAFRSP